MRTVAKGCCVDAPRNSSFSVVIRNANFLKGTRELLILGLNGPYQLGPTPPLSGGYWVVGELGVVGCRGLVCLPMDGRSS